MNHRYTLLFIIGIIIQFYSKAQNFDYTVSTHIINSNGKNAPYFFTTNQHGIHSIDSYNGIIRGNILKEIDKTKKFSYGLGIDVIGGYHQYNDVWIQQLYGELKYRCLYLMAGSKELNSLFRNQELSSGSLIWSGNARPIPQVKFGIPYFVSVPGTKGWLQIKGDLAYGKFTDNNWLKDHYNKEESFITTGTWFHEKNIFFRTKENKPFVFTVGLEIASQFGGDFKSYIHGNLLMEDKASVRFKDFLKVLIPIEYSNVDPQNPDNEEYYYGNHIGNWQIMGEYRLGSIGILKGYTEWLFEDGSGIGKLNGFDGLWGIEYQSNDNHLISNVVVEYLQTTNQSGPIHWAPDDFPGTSLTSQATGSDDYYNNYHYNGWMNYGMANGNPMLTSPIYNKDGYLRFNNTRVQGGHIGLKGYLTRELSYILKGTYYKTWGTYYIPLCHPKEQFSSYLQLNYSFLKIKGLQLNGAIGWDKGNICGNNLGLSIGIQKTGNFSFK